MSYAYIQDFNSSKESIIFNEGDSIPGSEVIPWNANCEIVERNIDSKESLIEYLESLLFEFPENANEVIITYTTVNGEIITGTFYRNEAFNNLEKRQFQGNSDFENDTEINALIAKVKESEIEALTIETQAKINVPIEFSLSSDSTHQNVNSLFPSTITLPYTVRVNYSFNFASDAPKEEWIVITIDGSIDNSSFSSLPNFITELRLGGFRGFVWNNNVTFPNEPEGQTPPSIAYDIARYISSRFAKNEWCSENFSGALPGANFINQTEP